MVSGTTPVKKWGKQDTQRKKLICDVVTKGPWVSQGKLCCWGSTSELSPLGLYQPPPPHQPSSHQILAVSISLSHILPSNQEGWRETQMRGLSHQSSQQLGEVPPWIHHSNHYKVQDAFQPLRCSCAS